MIELYCNNQRIGRSHPSLSLLFNHTKTHIYFLHSPRLALKRSQAEFCVSPLARISSNIRAGCESTTAPPSAVVPSHPNSRTSFFVVKPPFRISADTVLSHFLLSSADRAVAADRFEEEGTTKAVAEPAVARRIRAMESFMVVLFRSSSMQRCMKRATRTWKRGRADKMDI